jgi:hypothetical protein
MYVYMYVYMYVCTCMYVCMYVYVYVCTYVCLCVCVCVCVYVIVYVCVSLMSSPSPPPFLSLPPHVPGHQWQPRRFFSPENPQRLHPPTPTRLPCPHPAHPPTLDGARRVGIQFRHFGSLLPIRTTGSSPSAAAAGAATGS